VSRTGADELRDFYEGTYSHSGEEALRYERWRSLSAEIKADHVLALLQRTHRDRPQMSVLDVGCGDASVLAQLIRRRPGWAPAGVELSEQATAIACDRLPAADIRSFDGERLPWPDASFGLGVLSHVIEHVPDPGALLWETGRVCDLVLVEVPLEANLSARRPRARAASAKVGHLHRFSRADVREYVARAGLDLLAETVDPLPRSVHRFFAAGPARRRLADVKWLLRAGAARASTSAAQRLFTMHYAALGASARPRAG